jgi:hypothetical protein
MQQGIAIDIHCLGDVEPSTALNLVTPQRISECFDANLALRSELPL